MNAPTPEAEDIDPALKAPQARRAGRAKEFAAASGLQRESLRPNFTGM